MSRKSLLSLAAATLVLAACGVIPQAPPRPPAAPGPQLEFALASGTYQCELGVSLQLDRQFREGVNYRILLDWNGSRYQLERDPSKSGLPRFEDAASGLVWIDLPWKGVLLDGKSNTPLVNECQPG